MKKKCSGMFSLLQGALPLRWITAIFFWNLIFLYVWAQSFWGSGLEWNFANFYLWVMNNRYLILWVSGLSMIVLYYKIVSGVFDRLYVRFRIGSEFRSCMVVEILILCVAALFFLIQFLLIGVMGLVAGVSFTWGGVEGFFSLCGNLFLYYVALGNFVLLVNRKVSDPKWANLLAIAVLLVNEHIYRKPSLQGSPVEKFSWIRNVIVLYPEDVSFHPIYWLLWIIALLLPCLWVNGRRHLPHFRKGNYVVFSCAMALPVFGIYALSAVGNLMMSGNDPVSNLALYFIGYQDIGKYLFIYLFYQLPIWMLGYYFLTSRFSAYTVYYVMEFGSAKKWLLQLTIKVLGCVAGYYGVGVIVLLLVESLKQKSIINGQTNGWTVLFLVINLFMQTLIILLISFFVWLGEEQERHIGFIITLMVHLILGVAVPRLPAAGKWIPLTQGIYCTHMDRQVFCLFYQLLCLVALMGGMYWYYREKQENIISKKVRG